MAEELTFSVTVDVNNIIFCHYSKHGTVLQVGLTFSYSKHVTVLQVELTSAEVESLRSEIADAEERESHLKAQYDLPDCLFHCSII